MMSSERLPLLLEVGSRVFGSRTGTIIGFERPYPTIDMFLYSIRWDGDPEQITKCYGKDLSSIGRCSTLDEFIAAVKVVGRVVMYVGPRGGFRRVEFKAEYNGKPTDAVVCSLDEWRRVYEPLVKAHGATVARIPE